MLALAAAFVVLAVPATAQKAEERSWRHALSLFGEVKYPADFKHFDYVNPNAPKGGATRQVTNMMSPDTWRDASKLMVVELLTPDGNWSSYPPHRHDDSPECPVNNEEIYYFRIGVAGSTEYAPEGFGLHRTYTGDGRVDDNLTVSDGDVYLIPRGYHGPCVAAPGYTMYYLNVLAGPGGERSMAFCDDPTHHWVRQSWEGMATDPRCPMTDARGIVTYPSNTAP